jgi:hypothetical protein
MFSTKSNEPRRIERGPSVRHGAAAIALLVSMLPGTGHAQAIDTNRPGFSFTPGVVEQGAWQLETGMTYGRFGSGSRAIALPNAEFRYGVGGGTEVFVSGISWIDSEAGNADASGFGDISLGTKIALGEPDSTTRMALLFLVSAPTGKQELSSDRWDPSLGLVWSRSGSLPLAGTVKVSDLGNGFQLDNGLKLPFAIDDRRSAFVEWEANLPENGSSRHWLNSGFQWLLSDDVQIDVSADLGLNDVGDDYRFGIGFSMRL